MIGAILAFFTTAALMGQEEPVLVTPFRTLSDCQKVAASKEVMDEARANKVVALCLQLKAGV